MKKIEIGENMLLAIFIVSACIFGVLAILLNS